MKKLKLYWSTSLQNGRKNFGDWLSPVLCEALSGMEVVHARPNNCDLMAVGSILAKAKNHFWNRKIDIWGSGLIENIGRFKSPHRIHALRGRNSANAIINQENDVLGDPGLLCGLLVPDNITAEKQYAVAIVPHYVDQQNPLVQGLADRIDRLEVIDIFSETRHFIKQVAACDIILSSSLHGLIVADALGIPNRWIQLSGGIRGKNFKFHDYYSAFGLTGVRPFQLTPSTTRKDLDRLAEGYARPGLENIKNSLLEAFPFRA